MSNPTADQKASAWDEPWDLKPGGIAFKSDNERLRWVLDAKVRAMAALASLQSGGKDGDARELVKKIGEQILELKL